jgi:hypothetical protein
MKKKTQESESRADRMARKLVDGIHLIQRNWADWMHRLIGKYSVQKQKFGFLLIGLLFSGYCLYLIISGLSAKDKKHLESAGTIPLPKVQQQDRDLRNSSDSLIVTTLRDFYHKRDSLLEHNPQQWQWLIDKRPGLLDSIERLENYLNEK